MNVTLDRQTLRQRCTECGVEFATVRGTVFIDEVPAGLYLVALHGHFPGGRLAHAAVALLDEAEPAPLAAAILITAGADQYEFSAVDWAESPWRSETYLGQMLDRAAVLASPHRAAFFHVASHIAAVLPEVASYFAENARGG